jgi:carboxyl-terminal processing protease
MRLLIALTILLVTALGSSQADYGPRFEAAWHLVNDRYWNLEEQVVDWAEIRELYESRALKAIDEKAFYSILEDMYLELGDNHSIFIPPDRVAELRAAYGNLPCLGIFSQVATAYGTVHFELLRNHIGYIKLPELASQDVAKNVRRAVRVLIKQQATGLVLDLRGNPGGRLMAMMKVAGIFTRGFLWRTITNWTLPIPYPALGSIETQLPLVILIDGEVHSAAEGLAGALQNRGRATLIGERTAGNVEAILPFCLPDSSQAWIATGVLAPIGGPTWEGLGVIPDIPSRPSEAIDIALRFLETP